MFFLRSVVNKNWAYYCDYLLLHCGFIYVSRSAPCSNLFFVIVALIYLFFFPILRLFTFVEIKHSSSSESSEREEAKQEGGRGAREAVQPASHPLQVNPHLWEALCD